MNELRAARAAQPKAIPTSVEWSTLEGLREQMEFARENLIAAEQDEKAFYRERYNETKRLLERERLQVVRDMHRRRRNGTDY